MASSWCPEIPRLAGCSSERVSARTAREPSVARVSRAAGGLSRALASLQMATKRDVLAADQRGRPPSPSATRSDMRGHRIAGRARAKARLGFGSVRRGYRGAIDAVPGVVGTRSLSSLAAWRRIRYRRSSSAPQTMNDEQQVGGAKCRRRQQRLEEGHVDQYSREHQLECDPPEQ